MLNRVFQPTTIPDTGERISARFTFDAPQFGAKFIYRAVAIKVLSRTLTEDPEVVECFNRESLGIAHLFVAGEAAESAPVMGTPSYMSPEQKEGSAGVTMASDIYSLGVVMYELFTWKKPVVGMLPSAIDRKIPRRLDEIIVNCLRADPADRYESFDEILPGTAP